MVEQADGTRHPTPQRAGTAALDAEGVFTADFLCSYLTRCHEKHVFFVQLDSAECFTTYHRLFFSPAYHEADVPSVLVVKSCFQLPSDRDERVMKLLVLHCRGKVPNRRRPAR